MNAPELLKALEGAGGFITVADSRIRCEVPEQAMHLLPGLREQRREIARVIEERQRRLAQNVDLYRDGAGDGHCGQYLPQSGDASD